ncbi:MAG: ATP-binding protein [Flavobacteriales bacterium]|nr:ATP-binding protein [Flavobacteriales bacterium]
MEEETTPFDFGSTVNRVTFTNRTKDLERLKGNMAGGINTILISPRRWGKSSLVEQAAIELGQERKNARVAVLDMFACNNFEEFLENLSREVLKATSSKWEEQVRNAKTFFRNINPRIEVGNNVDPGISIGFDWKHASKHVGDILDMPERIAQAKKLRLVICVDEFQNMTGWYDDLRTQKLMRAHWQRHKHVTYVLYGSKRQMMAKLFDHSGKPFFRFGDILWLQRIALEHWTPFIVARFKSTGRSIAPGLATALANTMKCHSWYVQQLAHFTWSLTRKKADHAALERALELVLDSNTPLYQLQCENLSLTGINMLRAIANGETQLTSAAVMHEHRLGTSRNVQKARAVLEGKDLIERTTDGYAFLDPGFELWFKREFLGIPAKVWEARTSPNAG